ncbi:MAG TPA: alpha/beta fold hydrolase, partial [Anaerolineae bacterium]
AARGTQIATRDTHAEPSGTRQASAPIVIPTPSASNFASIAGLWEGPLKVAGQELNMAVRFKGSGSTLVAFMDIPVQGAKDIPLSKVSQQGNKVHFEAFTGARLAVYEGQVQADGSLVGNFQQAGFKGTFVLKPVAVQPTAAVDYRQEEVTYKNGDITLAGTLTLPATGSGFPALLLITGSGPQNRDEDLLGFQPFRLIADYLTPRGFAVLRVDDRGVGGSTGDLTQSTSEDLAGDVLAGVNLLKSRPDIDAKRIGLLGHSEGGLIAPMAATRSNDVAFIILLSGPGLPGSAILKTQLVDIMRASGSSQAQIDQAAERQQQVLDAVTTGKGWDELTGDWQNTTRTQIEAMPADQVSALGGVDKAVDDAVRAQRAAVDNPWFKFFVNYDPAPTLANVHVPVLALFGGKDTQVAAVANEAAVKAALEKGGNARGTTKIFSDANHLYQQAVTGSPSEYGTLLKEFLPGFLDYIYDWTERVIR